MTYLPPLWAGFESGYLGWCDQDLLHGTNHLPQTDMAEHYRDALTRGAQGFRDGLPWRHDVRQRIDTVRDMNPVWDLHHFDPPADHHISIEHARRCAGLLGQYSKVLAVNEPMIWPILCGRSWQEAVRCSVEMMTSYMEVEPQVEWWTCDPFHHLTEYEFQATDELVATGLISVIGINHYPHEASVPLLDVLKTIRRRYPDHRLAITETGLHEGHPRNGNHPWTKNRWAWLQHVYEEVFKSHVGLEAICWYPWLDMPVWGQPDSEERWKCGFPQVSSLTNC